MQNRKNDLQVNSETKNENLIKVESIDQVHKHLEELSVSKQTAICLINFDSPNAIGESIDSVSIKNKKTLHFIEQLQKSFATFGFTTARTGKPDSKATETTQDIFINTLKQLGCDFSNELPVEKIKLEIEDDAAVENSNLVPYAEPDTAMYDRGIIFSNNQKKEQVLQLFILWLEQLTYAPSTLIFIDANFSNLLSLETVCKKLNNEINFIGFHYMADFKKDNQKKFLRPPVDKKLAGKNLWDNKAANVSTLMAAGIGLYSLYRLFSSNQDHSFIASDNVKSIRSMPKL